MGLKITFLGHRSCQKFIQSHCFSCQNICGVFSPNLYVFLCRRSSKNASERVGWGRNKQRLRSVYKSKLAGKENWVRNKQRLRIVYKSKLAGKENWVRNKQRLRIVYKSKLAGNLTALNFQKFFKILPKKSSFIPLSLILNYNNHFELEIFYEPFQLKTFSWHFGF